MTELAAEPAGAGLAPLPQIAGLTLEALDPACLLLLSGGGADAGFAEGVHQALALDLPRPNRLAGDDPTLVWQGPHRWLLYGERAGGDALQALATAFGGTPPASDVTDGFLVVRLAGTRLSEILSMGSSLSLADGFPVGGSAVTRFAELTACLLRPAEDEARLLVERASRTYLWSWLDEAAQALTWKHEESWA